MTAQGSPSVTFVFLPEHDAGSHQALHKQFLNARTEVEEHFFLWHATAVYETYTFLFFMGIVPSNTLQ